MVSCRAPTPGTFPLKMSSLTPSFQEESVFPGKLQPLGGREETSVKDGRRQELVSLWKDCFRKQSPAVDGTKGEVSSFSGAPSVVTDESGGTQLGGGSDRSKRRAQGSEPSCSAQCPGC